MPPRCSLDAKPSPVELNPHTTPASAPSHTQLPSPLATPRAQVLQADGGTRCACINAAALALADAGVPMRDLVASCAAGYLDNHPILDLNYVEDSAMGPDVSVALHPNLDKVVLLQMDSRLPIDTFEAVTNLAVDGCRTVAGAMRAALLAHTKRLATAMGAAASVR